MKIFAYLLAASFVGLVACKNSNSTEKQVSKDVIHETDSSNFTLIAFPDSMQDFGKVSFGEKVKLVYHFKNIGEKPLYVTNVQPSCGCTVAEYTKEAVLPGKEGEITATFDSNHGAPGLVRKSIVVTSNTKNSPNYVLAFMGESVKK